MPERAKAHTRDQGSALDPCRAHRHAKDLGHDGLSLAWAASCALANAQRRPSQHLNVGISGQEVKEPVLMAETWRGGSPGRCTCCPDRC